MVGQEFLLMSRCTMEKDDAQWRGERPEGRDNIFFLSLIFSCLAVKPGFHLTPPSELLIQPVREDLLGEVTFKLGHKGSNPLGAEGRVPDRGNSGCKFSELYCLSDRREADLAGGW